MTHLSDEQFDDILQGDAPEPDHLAECELYRGRLAERRAVRDRLRSAFSSVRASDTLVESIRHSARSSATSPEPAAVRTVKIHHHRFSRWLLPLTAAAALFLVGIPAIVFFTGAESASAAPAELFRIHQHSLSSHAELYTDADPKSLAGFLRDELGFKPAVPKLGAGMSLRGCCIAHFRDQPVGSYVVDTPRGVISVIVVTESPASLGMKDRMRRGDQTYLAGSFAMCEMVTAELGGYTYCAVGEVSRDELADLLEQLVR